MSDQPDHGAAGTPARPAYPGVHVQLTGMDSNARMIIALVARALRRHVDDDAATAFTNAAQACRSYDELLQLAMSTVDVA